MRLKAAIGLVLLASLLAACGSGKTADSQEPSETPDVRQTANGISGSFVGKVDGSDSFIGIVVLETRETLAYICDSKLVSQWFRGSATADGLALSAGAAKLEATLSMDGVAGQVTLASGNALSFRASPATGAAGLYRAARTEGSRDFVGGWIILASGEQRGAVTAGPSLAIGTPTPQITAVSGQTSASGATPLIIQNPVLAVTPVLANRTSEKNFLGTLQAENAKADSVSDYLATLVVLSETDTALVSGREEPTKTPSKGGVVIIKPVVVATAVVLQPVRLSSAGTSAGLK